MTLPIPDHDAFATRRAFITALTDAVQRYTDATGTNPALAVYVGVSILEQHAGVLRAQGAKCVTTT